MTESQARRHRRSRTRSNADTSARSGAASPRSDAASAPSRDDTARATDAVASDESTAAPQGAPKARDLERGWRDLAGNTPSQVGISGALRARDIARPRPDDLAEAEREVAIVRRDWKPPTDTPVFGANRPNRK